MVVDRWYSAGQQQRAALALTLMGALALGCGSDDGDASAGNGSGASAGNASGGASSGGTTGASGGSSAGGASGAGGTQVPQGPPANRVGGFEIQLPDYVLQPGQEETPCYVFDLELDGPSHFVAAGMLETGDGLHHGNITTRPKTGDGFRECEEASDILNGSEAGDVLKGGTVLFGSTTQVVGQEWRHFPEGMAFEVKDGYEIVARMHYLNSSQEPVTVAPRYEWHTVPEESVVTELGPFFWQMKGFRIPPRAELTVEANCTVPPMKIVDAMPHMHALGRTFRATYVGGELDGEAFIDQPFFDADTAIRSFQPAIDIGQGTGLTFSCHWNNTFDKEIVEGIGDNEMCMLFGYGYPPEASATLTASPDGPCLYILPPGD